jgi:hypothetical protein
MKVMMLIVETPQELAKRAGPAGDEHWAGWRAYSQAVQDKTVGGNTLDGSDTAVTLRVKDGERQVHDGPFADSKESLGGYMIFDVPKLDEALELASTCPAATSGGAVELRPIVEMS